MSQSCFVFFQKARCWTQCMTCTVASSWATLWSRAALIVTASQVSIWNKAHLWPSAMFFSLILIAKLFWSYTMDVLSCVILPQVQQWWTGWCSCSWFLPVWRLWRWPQPCWRRVSCELLVRRVWRHFALPASARNSWMTPLLCTALYVALDNGKLAGSKHWVWLFSVN